MDSIREAHRVLEISPNSQLLSPWKTPPPRKQAAERWKSLMMAGKEKESVSLFHVFPLITIVLMNNIYDPQ